MGAHLWHGDIAAAWSANQFVFLLLAGIVVASIAWTVQLLGGPALQLPGRLRDQRFWYAVIAAGAVGFAVLRNAVPLG